MSVENLLLRKLLQMMYAGETQRRALVRADVRTDFAKASGNPPNGGDFYGPFWADVKDHISGKQDLRQLARDRIEKNSRRERLYPDLTRGFLRWWDTQRRWTNEPFAIIRPPSATFRFNEILTIKLDNFLSVRDAHGVDRFVYPYFYETPVLKNEAARVALWTMQQAFKGLKFENFRILDVIRGRVFSPDRCYLEGDEEEILQRKHRELWNLYVEIEEDL